jgi:hypothetical protein
MKNKIVYLSILLLAIASILVYSWQSGGGYGTTTNPPQPEGKCRKNGGNEFLPANLTVTKAPRLPDQ